MHIVSASIRSYLYVVDNVLGSPSCKQTASCCYCEMDCINTVEHSAAVIAATSNGRATCCALQTEVSM
jgi:hypothetical protein